MRRRRIFSPTVLIATFTGRPNFVLTVTSFPIYSPFRSLTFQSNLTFDFAGHGRGILQEPFFCPRAVSKENKNLNFPAVALNCERSVCSKFGRGGGGKFVSSTKSGADAPRIFSPRRDHLSSRGEFNQTNAIPRSDKKQE